MLTKCKVASSIVVMSPDIIIRTIGETTVDRSYSAEPLVTRDCVGVGARSSSVRAFATIATEVACLKVRAVASRGPYAAVATLANCTGDGISSLTFY